MPDQSDKIDQGSKDSTPEERRGAVAFAIFICGIAIALGVISVAKLGVPVTDPDTGNAGRPSLVTWMHVVWLFSSIGAIWFLFRAVNADMLGIGPKPSLATPQPASEVQAKTKARRGKEQAAWKVQPDSSSWSDDAGAGAEGRSGATWLRQLGGPNLLVGALCFVASLLAVYLIVGATNAPPPPNQRFALVFDKAPAAPLNPWAYTGVWTNRSAIAAGLTSAGKASGQVVSPTMEEPGSAVLFWSVPGQSANPRDGLLAMFMACLLVAVFGLYYPQMRMSGGSDTASFIQKLVVPLISLGLFGVGVQQQAQAEQLKQDVDLAKQGLPPAMFLSHEERLYVLNRNNLQASTLNFLQGALVSQQEFIQQNIQQDLRKGGDVTDLSQVVKQIADLRDAIDQRPGKDTRVIVRDSALLARLIESTAESNRNAITAAKESVEKAVQRSDDNAIALRAEQDKWACREIGASLEEQEKYRTNLYTSGRESKEAQANDVFRSLLLALKGEVKAKLAKARAEDAANARKDMAPIWDMLAKKCARPEQNASR